MKLETCKICSGEGVVHTGIDESPTTYCGACDGSGNQMCDHGVAGECDECQAEASQELSDMYAEYHASVL